MGDTEIRDGRFPVTNTRRSFLGSAAALVGEMAASTSSSAQQRQASQDLVASSPDPTFKMPRVKLGKIEVSRLILGVNPFLGGPHFNSIYAAMMREWYTAARVVQVLRQCERYGITALNYAPIGRAQADWERYLAEGGKMQLVAQGTVDDPAELINAVKPVAVWVQGERTDNAYRAGSLEPIRDYCKKMRDMGAIVGVGSHIPEVLAIIEDAGWDVDFYAGCAYNRRRTPEEFRRLLGGELPEMPSEIYLQDDPPRMYKFFRQTAKPCCAFKIMAAGRVRCPEAAFELAFQSIKPTDFVCVGMCPRIKDEVRENAHLTSRYGAVSS